MKQFVPPGGVLFLDAFDAVHRRMFGGKYIADRTQAEQAEYLQLGQKLRLTEASKHDPQQLDQWKLRRADMVRRADARSAQVRQTWMWWRGQLYNNAPPTRLLGTSGVTLDVPAIVWSREDFRGQAFDGGWVRFYAPGYSDVLVGTLFFWRAELERSIAWAETQPSPLEAHASWSEISATPEVSREAVPPAGIAPGGRDKFKIEGTKKAWLTKQLGGELAGPLRDAEFYKAIALNLAAMNQATASDDEVSAEANRWRSLHNRYIGKA